MISTPLSRLTCWIVMISLGFPAVLPRECCCSALAAAARKADQSPDSSAPACSHCRTEASTPEEPPRKSCCSGSSKSVPSPKGEQIYHRCGCQIQSAPPAVPKLSGGTLLTSKALGELLTAAVATQVWEPVVPADFSWKTSEDSPPPLTVPLQIRFCCWVI